MPRGVYKRKAQTLTNTTIGELFPAETLARITDHCKRNDLDVKDFIRKAVYDVLPVYYDATDDFVFPFGKYVGETVGAIKKIDPGYITWCQSKIAGFNIPVSTNVGSDEEDLSGHKHFNDNDELKAYLSSKIAFNESLVINKKSAWGHSSSGRWRKLAVRYNYYIWKVFV